MNDSNFSSNITSIYTAQVMQQERTNNTILCELRILFGLVCVWVIWKHVWRKSLLSPLTCFIAGIFASPIVCVAMILLYLYRRFVGYLLQKQYGSLYGGLIQGPDVMWAMEHTESRSIITILLIVEKSSKFQSSHELLDVITRLAENSFFVPESQFQKLCFLRQRSSLGYYFWYACPNLKAVDFVRTLVNNAAGNWSEAMLKQSIGENCNRPMPHGDSATWEILVGQESLTAHPCHIPVLVRMHHCVGDGVALVRLLLEALGDTQRTDSLQSSQLQDMTCNQPRVNAMEPRLKKKEDVEHIVLRDVIIMLAVVVIVSVICTKRSLQFLLMTVVPLLSRCVGIVYLTPYVLYKETFGNTSDSVLFGKQLSGKKRIAWVIESDATGDIMQKIRRIRQSYGHDTKFTDVLLTCLSRSLVRFYELRDQPLPDCFYVVLPARIDMQDLNIRRKTGPEIHVNRNKAESSRFCSVGSIHKQRQRILTPNYHCQRDKSTEVSDKSSSHSLRLENKFTVAMINLPLLPSGSDFGDTLSLIQKERERLKNAPDYFVNYWLLGWVAHLIPAMFLRPFLSSAPCSMVLSNLPGPVDTVSIDNNHIHGITFWVPNRGLNGVGMGVLSYCGRLSMGVMADKTLMTAYEADSIITGLLQEIDDTMTLGLIN